MKYLGLILLGSVFMACNSSVDQGETILTLSDSSIIGGLVQEEIEIPSLLVFDSREFDFGEITQGDVIEHVFRFQNTATVPVRIITAKASCGCTLADKPEGEILPNEFGEIKVKFNSSGKKYKMKKRVRLTTNLNSKSEILYLKGYVVPLE